MEMQERVESLIPYKELNWNPKSKLGVLNVADNPWVIATKLGRYLLSDGEKTSVETQKGLAIDCYCELYDAERNSLVPYDAKAVPDWLSIHEKEEKLKEQGVSLDKRRQTLKDAYASLLALHCAREANPDKPENAVWYFWDESEDCLVILGQKDLKNRYLGEHHWASRSNHYAKVKTRALRLPMALGAIELCGDNVCRAQILSRGSDAKWAWKQRYEYIRNADGGLIYDDIFDPSGKRVGVSARKKPLPNHELDAFLESATKRWGEEDVRYRMRRWASNDHTAAVFEDKLHCDDAHKHAATHGFIGSNFGHCEIDNDVDLVEYKKLDHEFACRYEAHELPQIDMNTHQMRFRKTLRHKAIGLYAPMLLMAPHHGIAVDVRNPKSLLHEFAHAYDFENGLLSMRAEFNPILDAFLTKGILMAHDMEVSDTQWKYACTPTEVFARSWEVYAVSHGLGGSFVAKMSEYKTGENSWMYLPLLECSNLLDEYFGEIYAHEGFTEPAVIPTLMTKAPSVPTFEVPLFFETSEQLSLFGGQTEAA